MMSYVTENKLQETLEVEIPYMAVKDNELEVFDVGDRINVGP